MSFQDVIIAIQTAFPPHFLKFRALHIAIGLQVVGGGKQVHAFFELLVSLFVHSYKFHHHMFTLKFNCILNN